MRPLVDPGPELSAGRRLLGSRTAALPGVGESGLRRLAATRVLVVGAGGLGSPVVALLAGSGLGRLTIVDPDVVDPSNLARQTIFTTADVGLAKASVAADRARLVDPELSVVAVVGAFDPALVARHDVVVDCADSVAVTRSVSDACARAGIPFVWGTALGTDGQVAVFWDAGPEGGLDFHDLHPDVMPDEGSCALDGVVPALCGVVGSTMAAQVVTLVTGAGEPLYGRVVTVDADRWRSTESRLRRGPDTRRPQPVDETVPPLPSVAPAALAARLADPTDVLTLVDVRTDEERSRGVIGGSTVPADLPPGDGPVVVYCARGPRAVAWAAAHPERAVTVLDGGMTAWLAEGRPVVPPVPDRAGDGGGRSTTLPS